MTKNTERVEINFECMFPYGEHKGGGAYNLSSSIIIPEEKLPLIKEAIEKILNDNTLLTVREKLNT